MSALGRLDEIAGRLEWVTPGPWAVREARTRHAIERWVGREPMGYETGVTDALGAADATFIAHARQDVPDLVAALRAVLDPNGALRQVVTEQMPPGTDYESAVWGAARLAGLYKAAITAHLGGTQ